MRNVLALVLGIMFLAGCTVQNVEPYDYTAFKESKPKSILMVMPVNNSVEVKAETSVLARATYPLAELGYYVYPVALVDEVFKQNGLTDGNAIRNASLEKIYKIFGADSIFYVNVNEYGTSYKIIDSVTTVALEGKLVDLRTGKTLWEGESRVDQSANGGSSDLFGALIGSIVSQIINTVKDNGYLVAAPAMVNLTYYGKNGGLLVGPKHPYFKEMVENQ